MRVVVEIPIALPTWNCLLAADPWKRKRIREAIHEIVATSVGDFPFESPSPATDAGCVTLTASQRKLQLMHSFLQGYYRMIRPSTSPKSDSRSAKARSRKPSSRFQTRRK